MHTWDTVKLPNVIHYEVTQTEHWWLIATMPRFVLLLDLKQSLQIFLTKPTVENCFFFILETYRDDANLCDFPFLLQK